MKLQLGLPFGDGAAPESSSGADRRPHPIPYQGSKRHLADRILALVQGRRFQRFVEPFAGSAAMTLAAAGSGVANRFIIGESLEPLARIWQQVVECPRSLADSYRDIWEAQFIDPVLHFTKVRAEFNKDRSPAKLLYLLARCVKNSPRFNPRGDFNQSADKRRHGMRPEKMERELMGAARLLTGRTTVEVADYVQTLASATAHDLVYLDPPWEGTSTGRDKRYHQGLRRERLLETLADLNRRQVPFLLSYDGRCGEKTYGDPLPDALDLRHIELPAGRSSQATLNGRDDITVEALYVSPWLTDHCVEAGYAATFSEQPLA